MNYDVIYKFSPQIPSQKAINTNEIKDILIKAFSDKVREIHIIDEKKLIIGINFVFQKNIKTRLIVGPHPKDPMASDFRSFWNNMSDIHRFNDGKLAEVVELPSDDILNEIPKLAFQIHYNSSVKFDILDKDLSSIFEKQNTTFVSPLDAFNDLSSKISSMAQCKVREIKLYPLSPIIRGTNTYNVKPYGKRNGNKSIYAEAIYVLFTFKGTDKLPKRLVDLAQYKIAGFIHIHECLKTVNIQSLPTRDGLDILHQGYVFSMKGFHSKEKEYFEGLNHAKIIHRMLDVEYLHHNFIMANIELFPSFVEATRASTLWIRSKGVSSHDFSLELVELLMVYIYQNTEPCYNPSTALFRFIDLISNLSDSKINVFCLLDSESKKLDDNRAIAIFSPFCYDSEFSEDGPSFDIVKYLKNCAISALEYSNKFIFEQSDLILKHVFGLPTNHWKISINLNWKNMPYPSRMLFSKGAYKSSALIQSDKGIEKEPPIEELFIGLNPVTEFVNEVRNRYGGFLRIYYSEHVWSKIGLAFKHHKLLEKTLPINEKNLFLSKINSSGTLSLDFESLFEQIKFLGGDLIKEIEII